MSKQCGTTKALWEYLTVQAYYDCDDIVVEIADMMAGRVDAGFVGIRFLDKLQCNVIEFGLSSEEGPDKLYCNNPDKLHQMLHEFDPDVMSNRERVLLLWNGPEPQGGPGNYDPYKDRTSTGETPSIPPRDTELLMWDVPDPQGGPGDCDPFKGLASTRENKSMTPGDTDREKASAAKATGFFGGEFVLPDMSDGLTGRQTGVSGFPSVVRT
jgi:hypothetical protein